MTRLIVTFFALLGGTALFVTATGLLSTALALRAGFMGYPEAVTGAVMSAYFLGFMAGTFLCPHIVAQVGHIRTFATLAALAAAAVLAHALLLDPLSWALLRLISGMCVVGLYMVVESWLNERATNQSRGRIFAFYQIISLASLALGQWLILLDGIASATPFLLCGALFALGLVPIALTRVPEPTPIPAARLDIRQLWKVSPLGLLGTLIAALANGVFFSLGPLYAQSTGMELSGVALFMSLVIVGGVALQWPLGHYSDRVDRRHVVLASSIAAASLAAIAALAIGLSSALFYLAVFFYGGFTFALYPLCVAHSNDHARPGELMRTAGGLLLVYGIGATAGPILMGSLMGMFGAGVFLPALVVTHLTLAGATLYRLRVVGTPAPVDKEPFVMLTRTSQSALEMLPSAPDDEHPAAR